MNGFSVGDRVYMVRSYAGFAALRGKVGTIVAIEPGKHWPIVVTFDGGDPDLEECPFDAHELAHFTGGEHQI